MVPSEVVSYRFDAEVLEERVSGPGGWAQFSAWCMTKANPRGPRFDLYPEIERTQKQLKRRIRDLMERNNNNGQPPLDGQELPAHADGVIVPPAQQMNQQLPARTVRDYLAEERD
ncbi:hypothetical protein V6N13_053679 [Hibiscus sabdariffa]